ncbi:uncharacterized protein BXIN_2601 [Babesia sp. Xinjiang]|uniref:uncharacterized protein n=1 Tax=Babesia sp. Xinjiang TaxID=462227 RepID=UPI000A25EF66|nr:uncharacterized protein BXIN_2719 [Babesia sp. Xinjiang]XP_028872095.1 uncharacterized protein BXIN_2601 [Babesia sp. Xinjiang]ORM41559.1 hypothetical protein BXIN_2719 [Babesia sp. Xinjiang]ORM41639.1 hypothetical protein BXIN_2601 [Babesia sp. Xinjiang]
MWYLLAFVAAVAVATPTGKTVQSDLQSVENEQKLLLHDLQHSRAAAAELKDKLDKLQQSKSGGNRTLNVSNVVVESGDKPEESRKGATNYTAPIIVLLPEAPSDREKWEYALTLRCLGQPNFSPFERIHNVKMLEMATIKGRTVAEIKREISQTEKELQQTRDELSKLESTLSTLKDDSYNDRTKKLHVSHNIKLVKHEIDVLETKLGRLQKRLKAAVLFGKGSSGKGSQNDDEGTVDEEGGEDMENGDVEEPELDNEDIEESEE